MPELTSNYKFKKPIFDKDTADIRVINENFDIADEEIKKINDALEKKADPNHTHDDRYYTESEIDMKFKNFCPYAVGDVYVTTSTTNPATRWTGTTWQKIEGRFLLGTSGSGASKATGGSNAKTIAQANLPNVKLTVNSFSLSRGTMDIIGTGYPQSGIGYINHNAGGSVSGAFYNAGALTYGLMGNDKTGGSKLGFQASRNWTGSTNSVAPQTSALGSGNALDVTPAYYTCHMWLRLT